MKTQRLFTMGILAIGLLLSGCSPRIIGVWQVENYEIISNSAESVKATNIGTIRFTADGNGQKELNFSVLGMNQVDKAAFTWVLNENFITVSGDSSSFVKTWIVLENKKNFQKLTSTDGARQVQVMELRRIKQ
ncbi:MAG: lipocalin family protein [Bacteroidales bacterium]|nr:lipocalin family protein [Bacteroidales bacterium]